MTKFYMCFALTLIVGCSNPNENNDGNKTSPGTNKTTIIEPTKLSGDRGFNVGSSLAVHNGLYEEDGMLRIFLMSETGWTCNDLDNDDFRDGYIWPKTETEKVLTIALYSTGGIEDDWRKAYDITGESEGEINAFETFCENSYCYFSDVWDIDAGYVSIDTQTDQAVIGVIDTIDIPDDGTGDEKTLTGAFNAELCVFSMY